jgi:hypothetical protein
MTFATMALARASLEQKLQQYSLARQAQVPVETTPAPAQPARPIRGEPPPRPGSMRQPRRRSGPGNGFRPR